MAAQLPWALRTVTAGSPSSLGLFAAAGYAGPGATGLLGLLGHRTRSQAFAAELVVAAASSIGHGAPTQTSVRPWILTAGTAGSISGSANSDSKPLRHEVAVLLGRRHLEVVLDEYVEHYNRHRPHRSLNQRSPSNADAPPTPIGDISPTHLRRTDVLGGLIHEYMVA